MAIPSGPPANNLKLPPIELVKILLIISGLGLVSFAGLSLSLHLGHIATIWPGNGILLGLLLTSRRNTWPLLIILAALANVAAAFAAGYPSGSCIRLAIINIVDVTVAIALLRRHAHEPYDLSVPGTLGRFTVIAVLASPFIAAALNGALLLAIEGQVSIPRLTTIYLAHALGNATLTPLMILLRQGELLRRAGRQSLANRLIALCAVICVTTLVFAQSRYPFLFLVYPPLVLAVLLMGLSGAALGLFFTSLIAIGLTVAGYGPVMLLHSQDILTRILVVQLFLSVAALLVFVLAAVLEDRNRVEAQLLQIRDQFAALATTDSLTGLTNRRGLDKILDTECRRANRDDSPISLLLLDVDHFKLFNDHYGHPAGDECLRAVAAIVGRFGRRPGDCTARYGGEEFIVLLAAASADAAMARAEALREAIEEAAIPHVTNPNGRQVVTVSIGVATIDPRYEPAKPAALLAQADENLYKAKRSGRNRVVASDVLNIQQASS